ncbi:amino acid permease [Streptomyces sp. Mg1]|nr:amino acid permease [Streptomyces sp. Mg1]
MTKPDGGTAAAALQRRLGVGDAVVIGLGSMIGAGIFAALAPAASAAGSGLLVALGLAGLVAYCNATSSARLAARYPASGGTYVYGRERLGDFWGYLAGWGFIVGKTASCAAMALTVGAYAWPGQAHAVAVAAVVALTVVNYLGVQKSAFLTRLMVAVVLAVLAAVVTVSLTSPSSEAARLVVGSDLAWSGVLQAAGLLFFAFAGYARIATLGEEVRDPQRTIPRAIPLALGITLVVYALVAVAVLTVLGPQGLSEATAPLSEAVQAAGAGWLTPVVRAGAALAALGSLLALILGSLAHDVGDGQGPAPAARPGRRPPPQSGAAPGRARRRCGRRGARRDRRRTRVDRFLLLWCPGLLRDRQRLRLDPHSCRRTAGADHPHGGAGRLPGLGLRPAGIIGDHRRGGPGRGRRRVRDPPHDRRQEGEAVVGRDAPWVRRNRRCTGATRDDVATTTPGGEKGQPPMSLLNSWHPKLTATHV